ncbi:polysaccharide biosynthesis/export family protein [Rhizobium sp.]|uniref:polysaccharide biosynthesis/export family protein n=1 Tax=Rhizobium sp. TaxID=391 RepID=UPI002AA775F8
MKQAIIVLSCMALASCQMVPADGPLTDDIVKEAGRSAADQQRATAEVFELIDVDARMSRIINDFQARKLQTRFRVSGSIKAPVIGIGDALKVTIFEASADGLFSTENSKQVTLDIVVQPNGTASIPYVGTVRLEGKTLEQVRQTIVAALKNKAVEPDVLVSLVASSSRDVTVSGAVARSSVIPLGLGNETILDMIARAGGAVAQPYETYVSLTRSNIRGSVLLKDIIENSKENIMVQPKDQIYVYRDPQTFTILGAVKSSKRVEFGANDLNLLEAIALAGGADGSASDMKGYFVFRFEEPEILSDLVGGARFQQLLARGMHPDKDGKYPVVYRLSLEKADSLLIGQTFGVKNRDVIYASRHPSVDFAKFLNIVGGPIGIVAAATTVSSNVE